MILGFRLEPTVGFAKTILVYIISGFGGILFSSLCNPHSIGVGASTAIFGIITAMIVWVIIHWEDYPDSPYKCMTIVWLIMLLLFNFMFGFSVSGNTDNYGHLGGALTGFLVGMCVFKPTYA